MQHTLSASFPDKQYSVTSTQFSQEWTLLRLCDLPKSHMFLCAKTEKAPQQSKLTGLVVAPNQLLAREVLINTEKFEVNKKKPAGHNLLLLQVHWTKLRDEKPWNQIEDVVFKLIWNVEIFK